MGASASWIGARSWPPSAPSRGLSTAWSRPTVRRWSSRCCSTPPSFSSITRPRKSSRRWPSKWTLAGDGRTYTLDLRPGLTFSDGAPFTADDVVFTFDALYDPKVDSPLASAMKVGGKPIEVRKTGEHQVVLTFPSPYGPGLRMITPLPMLPAHKLKDALAKGEFAKAWTTATPPAQLAGLGPYRPQVVYRRRPARALPQPALPGARARRPSAAR